MRLVSARSRVRSSLEAVRYGVVGNISACHADARGSIPRFGVLLFADFYKFTWEYFLQALVSVRYGVVGNISACHADARGSIPRFGVVLFFVRG